MSRSQDPLLQALTALHGALRDVGEPHMLIGGMAVILRGVARLTEDVDATVWGQTIDVDSLLATLARHGIVGRIPDVASFARERQVLLLRHEPTGTPMEVSLAWLPFEREALRRAEVIEVAGMGIPVARAQDLVVYKAIAWRDRDRADIERLLRGHASEIDLAEVRRIVAEFAEALGEKERLGEFDRLVARVTKASRQPPRTR